MSKDSWDSGKPDLSKLPKHLLETMRGSLALRPGEIRARIHIFRNTKDSGLHHPNGRLYVLPFKPDEISEKRGERAGVQLETFDFRGKVPLNTIIISPDDFSLVMTDLIRAYLYIGGAEDIIDTIKKNLETPRAAFMANLYSVEDSNSDND